jgi:hypothetical protein
MFDRFLIAPLNTGLQTDLKPWLIAEDAFQQLQNAYVFRGRVRKRFGSTYTGFGFSNPIVQPNYSRLGINVGPTDPTTGNLSGTVPGSQFLPGQQFMVGSQIFTVPTTGTPVTMLATAGTGTGTFNTSNGDFVITGAALNTIVWFYSGQPVMGLAQYDNQTLDNIPSIAFDTQFAYIYSGGQWVQFNGPIWHGDDTNLFWTTNWKGRTNNLTNMFVTNYQAAPYTNPPGTDDPIWFYDGSIWGNYTNYTPTVGDNRKYTVIRADGSFLLTARIIVAFKERLIALNTIEFNAASGVTANQLFVNRCRFTLSGSPFAMNTVISGGNTANAAFAWLEPRQNLTVTNGGATATASGAGAGFVDATTDEAIISAEFIKDRLIVYFEKSTWELVYTGNQLLPFYWQKINTELGSDSTFSIVPFDKEVLAIGNVGVHSCNGANVQRIDEKIPNEIFQLNEQPSAAVRVTGIRDYYVETVYWAYPDDTANRYPNQVLVYNYRNGAWAKNDDVITAMGYFDSQTSTTWLSSYPTTWQEANFIWNSGSNDTNFRQVIAGNQQGYVFIVNSERSTNAAVMSVTTMVQNGYTIEMTIIAHTLVSGEYISFDNIALLGITITDYNTPPNSPTIFQVNFIDVDTISIGSLDYGLILTGTYAGGAVVARVSNIQILSKQWNPYIGQGRNFYLARIDFCVTSTPRVEIKDNAGNVIGITGGQVTVDYYPSGSELSMLQKGNGGTDGTNMLMGNGILETYACDPAIYPFESQQARLWHPVYFQTDGQTIQIYIYFSADQITNPKVIDAGFSLEGLVLHVMSTSMRLQ